MAVALGFSCWFPGFLFFNLPFFLLPSVFVLWIEFTSTKTIGVEGVVAESFCCLEGLAVDEGLIKPTTPSTGVSAGGLAESMLGRGASGIRSYRVSDYEYTKSKY